MSKNQLPQLLKLAEQYFRQQNYALAKAVLKKSFLRIQVAPEQMSYLLM